MVRDQNIVKRIDTNDNRSLDYFDLAGHDSYPVTNYKTHVWPKVIRSLNGKLKRKIPNFTML